MYTSFWYMGIIFPHFLFSFWHFFLLKLITSLDQSLGQSNSQVAERYAWGLSGAGLLLVESALKIRKLFLCPVLLIIKSHIFQANSWSTMSQRSWWREKARCLGNLSRNTGPIITLQSRIEVHKIFMCKFISSHLDGKMCN